MNWQYIEEPLVPWGATLQKIMRQMRLVNLDGESIYLATDYSGSHKSSQYEVLSALYCDVQRSREWLLIQRGFREQFLPDGRRMSFKGLNDKHKYLSLIPFLKGANEIHGVCVSLVINKKIGSLVGGEQVISQFPEKASLSGKWPPTLLEQMLRIVHLVSLLVGGLAQPGQNIYWLSDEDAIFDTQERQEDMAKIMSSFTSHYVEHSLGHLGISTTKIDEGDRLEEDLAAIPDLVAGALSEMATSLAKSIGTQLPGNIAVPFYGAFTDKTEQILPWVWESGHSLARVVLLAEDQGKNGYTVSRFAMST